MILTSTLHPASCPIVQVGMVWSILATNPSSGNGGAMNMSVSAQLPAPKPFCFWTVKPAKCPLPHACQLAARLRCVTTRIGYVILELDI